MSATPFLIQPDSTGKLHIVNTTTHKRIATVKGKTARRRAEQILEWLRVGYFSNSEVQRGQ